MIAIIDGNGTIHVYDVSPAAGQAIARHMDAGTVVLSPGDDGAIHITPRPAAPARLVMLPPGVTEHMARAVMGDAPDTAEPAPAAPKPARKPRAKAPAPEVDPLDRAAMRAALAAGPQTIAQLRADLAWGDDRVHATLAAIGAVKSGKARGTRYSLPPVLDMPAHVDE